VDGRVVGSGCICFGVVFVVSIGLIAGSIKCLGATEYGLDQNNVSSNIDPTVYGSGRHFIGLMHSFLKFPMTMQDIEFSREGDAVRPPLIASTREQTEVTLEVSFQYKLIKSKLYELYERHKSAYNTRVADQAQSTLKIIAARFSKDDFFTMRREISKAMYDGLKVKFDDPATEMPVDIVKFQLRKIDVPYGLEKSIMDTVVSKQAAETAEANRTSGEILTENDNLKIKMTAEIAKVTSRATADGQAQQGQLIAQADKQVEQRRAQAYKDLQATVGMSNQELARLWWLRTVGKVSNADLFVGLNNRVPSVAITNSLEGI